MAWHKTVVSPLVWRYHSLAPSHWYAPLCFTRITWGITVTSAMTHLSGTQVRYHFPRGSAHPSAAWMPGMWHREACAPVVWTSHPRSYGPQPVCCPQRWPHWWGNGRTRNASCSGNPGNIKGNQWLARIDRKQDSKKCLTVAPLKFRNG